MHINDLIVRYGLIALAIGGLIECIRVFRITLLDKEALTAQRANGGKKIIVETRWTQSAFLLGVFAVLIGLGGRVALASREEMSEPLVTTMVVLVDVVALLLTLKEQRVLKGRERVDNYYDHQESLYTHRRKTDLPSEPKG